jgi:isocitrate dehydrogenase (NAD+)
MKHKVTLLPGEGIGPEVSAAVLRILDASGVQIEWEELAARAENTDKGTTGAEVLNTAAIASVRRNHVALKGPMATAIAGGARSVNVALRKSLDLYANLRPVKHRGFVFGAGARGGPGRGGKPEDHHGKGFHAHCALCV